MIKITDFTFDFNQLNGGIKEALLVGVKPYYEYIDGKPSNKQLGNLYETILPGRGFERLWVKIPILKSLISEEMLIQHNNRIRVSFIGFEAKFYFNKFKNAYLLTATASDIEVIPNDK